MDQIVVFVNGARGVEVLEKVQGSQHSIIAVVGGPNFQSDRIDKLVAETGTPFFRPDNPNKDSFVAELASLKPRLFLVAGYPFIFSKALLDIPTTGTINLHAGALPQYRGGSPLNWQLLNGEANAGISVLWMDGGIDTGNVLAKEQIPIGVDDTIADLHHCANALFPEMVLKCLGQIDSGDSDGIAQDEASACYWHQRNDADGHMNFRELTAEAADRKIRALTRPYPGAWAYYGENRVRLLAARVPDMLVKGAPGRICNIQGQGPYVVCKDHSILITEYSFEDDGLRNARLKTGMYFL